MALAWIVGAVGAAELAEEWLDSREVRELGRRIRVRVDEGLEARYPVERATRVAVERRDGRILERVVRVPRGEPEAPLTEEELADKLRGAVDLAYPGRGGEVVQVARTLAPDTPVRELWSTLGAILGWQTPPSARNGSRRPARRSF